MSYKFTVEVKHTDMDKYIKDRLKLLHKVHDMWTVSQVFDVSRRIAPRYLGVEDPRRKRLELPKKIHVSSIIQPESKLKYNVLTVEPDVMIPVMSLHTGFRLPARRPTSGRILKFPLKPGQKLYKPERGISPQTLRGPAAMEKTWVAAKKVRGKFVPANPKNRFIPISYASTWSGFTRNASAALKTGKTPMKINRKRITKSFRLRWGLA